MKFLACVHYSPLIHGSGAEKYLQYFLEHIAEKGDKAYCFSFNDYDMQKQKKKLNKVEYFHDKDGFESFEKIVEDIKPDYIICHLANYSDKIIQFAHKKGIRAIYIVHNETQITIDKIKLLESQDICVFNTFWIFKKIANMTRAKCCVVHPLIPRQTLKENSREYITFINPCAIKGVSIMYRTALILRNKKFLVVKGGYGNQKIVNLPNITFIDNTKDMLKDVWSKTNILFQPSMTETYGMGAAEAAQLGIPCVLSNTAGAKECLGKSKYIVASLNATDYASAIVKLLDEQEYQIISNRNKKFIEEDLDKNYFENFYKLV